MPRVNDHFLKLTAGYLFPEIARRVSELQQAHPEQKIIKLGIGDVTEPLAPAIRDAMHAAVDDMGTAEGFHGYGPSEGYDFLRNAIAEHDYRARGCDIEPDEIFVSDGSKCDSANILDIFAAGLGANRIAVGDPVYPVYVDTNVMQGNTGGATDGRYDGLIYMPATEETGFVPKIPDEPADLIYLCLPNNPTGAVATKDELAQWVAYAKQHDALILFDAAYEAFISSPDIPHSIYEIEGGRDVAIEFRSFSKTAGFTGTRCAFTIVPKNLTGKTAGGEETSLHKLWSRRQNTKFNGVSYIVQKGAAAAYSGQGKQQIADLVQGYMTNAALMRETLEGAGLKVFGGEHAPYVWIRCPEGLDSWAMFDKLLNEAAVVCTPGVGFGKCGQGYIRLSAFNSREKVEEALGRIAKVL